MSSHILRKVLKEHWRLIYFPLISFKVRR